MGGGVGDINETGLGTSDWLLRLRGSSHYYSGYFSAC